MLNIKKLCYELYKMEWERFHIMYDFKMAIIKEYFKWNALQEDKYTFTEYIDEFGFDGEVYVCYEEFLDNEYLDKDYICELLKDKELINLYYKDITETK